MGDEIDFDDLLADAEQEEELYDDGFMDDIEAELAMEAEVRARRFYLYSGCLHTVWPLFPRTERL